LPVGATPGQQPVNGRRRGEADEYLFDDPIFSDGPRHVRHFHIRRKKLADQVIAVEGADAVPADASRHGGNVVEMRGVAHRRHRRVEVAGELRADVLFE
jgi:hypothetical protein